MYGKLRHQPTKLLKPSSSEEHCIVILTSLTLALHRYSIVIIFNNGMLPLHLLRYPFVPSILVEFPCWLRRLVLMRKYLQTFA